MYDIRAKRRPLIHFPYGDCMLNRIDTSYCGYYLFVANQLGVVTQFDCRKMPEHLTAVHCIKGSNGTLRDIKCHPNKPLIGECGLNRYFK